MQPGRQHIFAVTSVVAIIIASTFALRVFAASNDTINACMNNSSGEVKIVTASDTCKSNETLLTWNQQGPTGAQGPQGPAGANGTNGTNGTNGVSGYEVNSAVFPTNGAGYALSGANGTPTFTQTRDCSVQSNCVLRVYCSTGKVAIGGGYLIDDTNGGSLNITAARTNTRAAQPGIFPAGENYNVIFNTTGIANPAASITVSVRCVAAN